uniref:Putative secreted protein n=1 Tax=Rhipicephalus microplus TaxID=6941 RepID=A0A6G5A432_RHIMP
MHATSRLASRLTVELSVSTISVAAVAEGKTMSVATVAEGKTMSVATVAEGKTMSVSTVAEGKAMSVSSVAETMADGNTVSTVSVAAVGDAGLDATAEAHLEVVSLGQVCASGVSTVSDGSDSRSVDASGVGRRCGESSSCGIGREAQKNGGEQSVHGGCSRRTWVCAAVASGDGSAMGQHSGVHVEEGLAAGCSSIAHGLQLRLLRLRNAQRLLDLLVYDTRDGFHVRLR